jgi:hypothetical protein
MLGLKLRTVSAALTIGARCNFLRSTVIGRTTEIDRTRSIEEQLDGFEAA